MPGADLGSVNVRIGVDGKPLAAGLKTSEAAVNSTVSKMGANFTKLGSTLTKRVTLPIIGTAAGAVLSFASFDDAMTQSLAIMDATAEQADRMTAAAREMAKTSTFSAKEAAESYFFLASAGLDAEASLKAMPVVTKFAQAGMFDMARATDILTDAQSALGLTIRDNAEENQKNMTKLSDILVKANTLANASVEQFGEALTTKAAAAMRNFGVETETGVAVLAALADQGIKGTIAGTQFSIALRDLTTQALKNRKAFDAAGVAVFDEAGNLNNMGDIIAQLESRMAGMSTEQKKMELQMLGFNDRSVSVIMSLLGTSDAIKGYEENLRNAGGTTEKVANKQLESFKSKMLLLWHQMQDVGITIGNMVAPVVLELAKAVATVVGWIGKLPGPVKVTIGVLLGLAATIGPMLLLVGKSIKLFNDMKAAIVSVQQSKLAGWIIGVTKNFLAAHPALASFGAKLLGILGPAGIAVGAGLVLGFLTKKLIEWHFAAKEKAAKATEELGSKFIQLAKAGNRSVSMLEKDLKKLQDTTKRTTVAVSKAGAVFKETNVEAEALANGGVSVTTTAWEQLDKAVQQGNIGARDAVTAYQAILGILDPMRGDLEHAQSAFKKVADQMASTGKVGRTQYIAMLIEAGFREKTAARQADALGLDVLKVGTRVTATGKKIQTFAGMSAEAFDEWARNIRTSLKTVNPALDKLAGKGKVTASQLKRAFEQQRKQMENYAKNLRKFADLNIPDELKQQIIDMGLEGAPMMAAFNDMTKQELEGISHNFNVGHRAVNKAARGITDSLAVTEVQTKHTADSVTTLRDRWNELSKLKSEIRLSVVYETKGTPPPGGVTKAAKGMDEVVRSPRLILAGEAGPERVTITPLGAGRAPAMIRPGGGRFGGSEQRLKGKLVITNWETGLAEFQAMVEDEMAEAAAFSSDNARMRRS
jgi:TP901 family phage tail tape measure protein